MVIPFKKTVFVAISGGVDSSVAAALLKERGFDVTGIFIKVWQPDFMSCPWRQDRLDAMRVCAHLEIPFLTFDFEEEYKREVVDCMIDEYKAGKTPNPDVMCNTHIKFGSFLDKAKEMGADYIATGHYVRLRPEILNNKIQMSNQVQNPKSKIIQLQKGVDANKDQSYFLWTITQGQLRHCLFPIGDYEKSEVRKMAKKFKLITAEKKDSQGVCFIGKLDMREFLKRYLPEKAGEVLNETGKVIGRHEGAHLYTIGQRHGFTVIKKGSNDPPYYVIAKNIGSNTLVVAPHREESEKEEETSVELHNINWIAGHFPQEDKIYSARTRYRAPLAQCSLDRVGESTVGVMFKKYQRNITSGQSLVVYEGDVCMGGGVIA